MVPMWFVLLAVRGGLQRSTYDCSLVFSAATVLMFLARSFLGHRVNEILRISPVRAARVGSAIIGAVCLLMPVMILKGGAAARTSFLTLLSLLTPVLLLSLLLCAAYIHRRATSALFFVCLTASFTSPGTIVAFVGGLSDVAVR